MGDPRRLGPPRRSEASVAAWSGPPTMGLMTADPRILVLNAYREACQLIAEQGLEHRVRHLARDTAYYRRSPRAWGWSTKPASRIHDPVTQALIERLGAMSEGSLLLWTGLSSAIEKDWHEAAENLSPFPGDPEPVPRYPLCVGGTSRDLDADQMLVLIERLLDASDGNPIGGVDEMLRAQPGSPS